jgi:hypothetical protein
MTLFRELQDPNKDKFIELSLKQQESVRRIFLDVGTRAQIFLTVIILVGLILVSLLIQARAAPTPRPLIVALACFICGLILVGVLHGFNFETSRVVLLRSTNRLRKIFRSEVPIEAADNPPVNLRWMYATSVLAYIAFLFWIVGTVEAFNSFVWADSPSAPRQIAAAPPSLGPPDRLATVNEQQRQVQATRSESGNVNERRELSHDERSYSRH